jgi:hypothetical protein
VVAGGSPDESTVVVGERVAGLFERMQIKLWELNLRGSGEEEARELFLRVRLEPGEGSDTQIDQVRTIFSETLGGHPVVKDSTKGYFLLSLSEFTRVVALLEHPFSPQHTSVTEAGEHPDPLAELSPIRAGRVAPPVTPESGIPGDGEVLPCALKDSSLAASGWDC